MWLTMRKQHMFKHPELPEEGVLIVVWLSGRSSRRRWALNQTLKNGEALGRKQAGRMPAPRTVHLILGSVSKETSPGLYSHHSFWQI